MITIVGANGAMGKRYQAILRHLGKSFRCFDAGDTQQKILAAAETASGVIIATPTNTHFDYLSRFSNIRKPILCEKPLSKELREVLEIKSLYKNNQLRLVNQYRQFVDDDVSGDTYYNYFRHGADGLYFDCISIVGLAKESVRLEETSPIWQCEINGQGLDIGLMDRAYIEMIKDWFKNPAQDFSEIVEHHEKVIELEARSRN